MGMIKLFSDSKGEPYRPRLPQPPDPNPLVFQIQQKGFTLVPLNLHYKGGLVKADIALAKGKNNADKRDTIKERDTKREIGRMMRNKS